MMRKNNVEASFNGMTGTVRRLSSVYPASSSVTAETKSPMLNGFRRT